MSLHTLVDKQAALSSERYHRADVPHDKVSVSEDEFKRHFISF